MADKKPVSAAEVTDAPAGETKAEQVVREARISEQVIRRRYGHMPVSVYRLKDKILQLTSNSSFLDALLILVAFIAVNSAFTSSSLTNFYPLPYVAVLLIVLFVLTMLHPFVGLLAYTVLTYPIYMYQTPVLAWAFSVAATVIILYGYKHYRVAVFTYILTGLALSPLGFVFEIPFFIFAILTIGNRRAIITIALVVALVVMFTAITGLQNTGYILYNAQLAHTSMGSNPIVALDAPVQPALTVSNFTQGFAKMIGYFTSTPVTQQVPNVMGSLSQPFLVSPFGYVVQFIILVLLIAVIDWYAVSSRSRYKGAIASMFGIIYPISYVALAQYAGQYSLQLAYTAFISFAITPALFYIMEYYNINTVRALDVRKQDIRQKFGEAFEDMEQGMTSETFDDIGNYEATKKELKEAIINPIEERGISRAYNVLPTKGILFFGPPGTGKTMIMRALANEIHAGFYYVKASNLVSAYAGETERMLANIFSIARKNAPCILFFDEIDALAMSRDHAATDETHRQALAQLLVEIDGFQKVNNVIIVGATNRPDVMDSALLRPGRFDKLVYIPLPDLEGRKKIFKIYLSKLPTSKDVSIKDLAEKSERFSGADIRSICENVAQQIAQEASMEHKVLEITQRDLLEALKNTKASTSMSQIETYKKFKIDYERSTFKTIGGDDDVSKKKITLNDVMGLDEVKKEIKDVIEIPLLYPALMKKYDIKPINGMLLFGPPGTGKTMLMRAISNSMKGVTTFEVSGAQLAEQGIERATATIREIFNRAKENAPAIVLMDELEGIIPSRTTASELGLQITTQVLKEIDGVKSLTNVVVVGATNTPGMIDPAMLRPGRFDKLLYVRPPNATERADMFKYYLGALHCSDDINYTRLGAETKGFTGADISSVVREAKTSALKQEVSTGAEGVITMDIIVKIIESTKPSVSASDLEPYNKFLAKYGRK